MPSWGPYLPLDDAPDPEFSMEHTGQGFITKELMIGMTTTESYNDFNAADIQVNNTMICTSKRWDLLDTYSMFNWLYFHLNRLMKFDVLLYIVTWLWFQSFVIWYGFGYNGYITFQFSAVWLGGGTTQSSASNVHSQCLFISSKRNLFGRAQRIHRLG